MSFRVLAIIAARSGSRGLRHKNIQTVGGATLLERAIHLADNSSGGICLASASFTHIHGVTVKIQ